MFHPANLHITSQSMRKHIVINSLIFEHLSCVCTQCRGKTVLKRSWKLILNLKRCSWCSTFFKKKKRFSSNKVKPLLHKFQFTLQEHQYIQYILESCSKFCFLHYNAIQWEFQISHCLGSTNIFIQNILSWKHTHFLSDLSYIAIFDS